MYLTCAHAVHACILGQPSHCKRTQPCGAVCKGAAADDAAVQVPDLPAQPCRTSSGSPGTPRKVVGAAAMQALVAYANNRGEQRAAYLARRSCLADPSCAATRLVPELTAADLADEEDTAALGGGWSPHYRMWDMAHFLAAGHQT